MGSTDSLEKVSKIIENSYKKDKKIIVVCSAMSGVTDQLLEIGALSENWKIENALKNFEEIKSRHLDIAKNFDIQKEFEEETEELFNDLRNVIKGISLIHELSDRSLAYLSTFGEKLATRLLSLILSKQNLPSIQLDSDFVKTKGDYYLEDDILWEETITETKNVLRPLLDKNHIPIVTGFWGVNEKNIICTLGRGGSDFSGAIFAVSLDIPVLEIWTDVDGFMSADPRIVKNATVIKEIGFEEVSELCFFGAKVLHPKTIRPVIENNGEVWIKNTFNPDFIGTKIANNVEDSDHYVSSISSKKVAMLTLDIFGSNKRKSKVFADLFSLADEKDIFIDMIAASEALISFCLKEDHLESANFVKELEKIAPLKIYKNRKIICVVSPKNVKGKHGVAANFFSAIAGQKISVDMYSQNASEIAQLVVVKEADEKKAIQEIHKKLAEI